MSKPAPKENVLNRFTLRFNNRELEGKYLMHYSQGVSQVLVLIFFITVFFLYAFNIVDRLYAPNSNPNLLLLIRIFISISCLTVFLAQIKTIRRYIDYITTAVFLLVGIGISIVVVKIHPTDSAAYYGYHSGIILVMIGAFNCILIRFVPAVISSVILNITYFALAIQHRLDFENIMVSGVFLISCNSLALYGAYVIDRLMRLDFYREIKLKYQKYEITESIKYASKIQRAVLPKDNTIGQFFDEYFILYKPRDIVSGDFYWFGRTEKELIVIAADCTGHGVPGAFMSMLGIAFLNNIVCNQSVTQPDEILNTLRIKVIEALQQKGKADEAKDGIDIASIKIDAGQRKLQYAGAHNPLLILRKGKIMQINADSMTVGLHHNLNPFKLHHVNLQQGDTIYIFSDGYSDQCGGADGRKFTIKQFKELLESISHEPIRRQQEILYAKHREWRGNFEQFDDILVIGIRV